MYNDHPWALKKVVVVDRTSLLIGHTVIKIQNGEFLNWSNYIKYIAPVSVPASVIRKEIQSNLCTTTTICGRC